MDATAITRALLPATDQPLRVEYVAIIPQGIFILLACSENHSVCPECRRASGRAISDYVRTVADLPWRQVPVVLRLLVRRFVCDYADCPRKVFAEQFPEIVRKRGRTTLDHEKLLARIGLACGGEGGSRLAEDYGMHASGDTVRRRMRRCLPTPDAAAEARVIGIDDFALRKGCRYGTLIVDHETGKLLDILPDRSSESVAAFLAKCPRVEIVTRDRYDAYANGIRMACPQALQVADRFHLHLNLDAAVVRLLDRHRADIARAREAAAQVSQPRPLLLPAPGASTFDAGAAIDEPRSTAQEMQKPVVPEAFAVRYEQTIALRKEGRSIQAIRARTKLNARTIMKYLRSAGFPPRVDRKSRRSRRAPRMSPRRLSSLMLYDNVEQKPGEQEVIDHLREQCPPVREGLELARECSSILQERSSGKLMEWIARARQSGVSAALRNFAVGLERDWPSVQPAMDLPWNNGRAEGHVNRLKMIKRSMYNRANFDLLRICALARGP